MIDRYSGAGDWDDRDVASGGVWLVFCGTGRDAVGFGVWGLGCGEGDLFLGGFLCFLVYVSQGGKGRWKREEGGGGLCCGCREFVDRGGWSFVYLLYALVGRCVFVT